ncbi:MAG TPA: hypothetical protein VNI20_10815, partial [Fimbriimonadaceae bacterium]|nr:hypothetical protein [Fimbriimonadaceae bacterium]
VATLSGHTDWVLGVAVAPNGKVVASSSTDQKILIWDIKSQKQVVEIPDRAFVDSLVAITGDGKYLLTSDAGNLLQVYEFDPPQYR